MCRFKRVLCIVGALVAVLFAIVAPGYACDSCDLQVEEFSYAPQPLILRSRVDYAAPVIERQVIRQKVVVPVQKQVVIQRQVDYAPQIQRVEVQKVRGPIFPRRARSKSVQIERIRY